MSNRAVQGLGAAAVVGVGYYLYTAGGSPKGAEKHAEADAHRLSASIKSGVGAGKGTEAKSDLKAAEKRGEALAHEASKALSDTNAEIKGQARQAKRGLEAAEIQAEEAAKAYAEQARKDLNKTVDNFDATVQRKTVEAKNGISSWLGFGGSSK